MLLVVEVIVDEVVVVSDHQKLVKERFVKTGRLEACPYPRSCPPSTQES